MAPSERHRDVARGYDVIARAYLEASLENRAADSFYRSFLGGCLARIEPASTILDLGCGAGIVVADLATRGCVVGIDLSLEQLRLARETAPEASFVQADMTEVELRHGRLDAVAAFWSVIHVDRERHAALFERIHAWLRPGGLLFGTFGADDNPDEYHDFFGAPMRWSHFDAATNRRLLVAAGFALEAADVVEDMGESPLWVIARA